MRILILHMRYAPDATGTGPLVTELAQDLVRAGHRVLVITSAPHYGRRDVPRAYRQGWLSKRAENGVEVWRTWAFAPAEGSALGRALDYLLYLLLSTVAGWRSGRHDVILCVAPPITASVSAWLIGRPRRTPILFNAQDIWPDGLIAMGRLKNRWLIRMLRVLERFAYRTAAKVLVVSDGMRDNIVGKGISETKVAVISNWVDAETIQPQPPEDSLKKDLGLSDRFVVLLAGNMGYAACLETVIQTAAMMRGNERAVFLLVGEGSAKEAARRQCDELGLRNVIFTTTQPVSEVSRVFASADVSLVTLRASMGRVSVPSKTYAIMASGRPVVAAVPEDSEVRQIVANAGCGVCVSPEAPTVLAATLSDLVTKGEQLGVWGANGRRYVLDHFGRTTCTSAYERALRDVLTSDNQPSVELSA